MGREGGGEGGGGRQKQSYPIKHKFNIGYSSNSSDLTEKKAILPGQEPLSIIIYFKKSWRNIKSSYLGGGQADPCGRHCPPPKWRPWGQLKLWGVLLTWSQRRYCMIPHQLISSLIEVHLLWKIAAALSSSLPTFLTLKLSSKMTCINFIIK